MIINNSDFKAVHQLLPISPGPKVFKLFETFQNLAQNTKSDEQANIYTGGIH